MDPNFEGRHVLDRFRSSAVPAGDLEQALTGLADELPVEGPRFCIWVMGRPKAFHPAIEKQIYLIVREAVDNALRHSAATSIETDVEYFPNGIRVVVGDNGLGIDQEVLRAGRPSHRGLLGMRERARSIGAQLRIWSRKGSGTEVEISVPSSCMAVRGSLQEKIPGLGTTIRESAPVRLERLNAWIRSCIHFSYLPKLLWQFVQPASHEARTAASE